VQSAFFGIPSLADVASSPMVDGKTWALDRACAMRRALGARRKGERSGALTPVFSGSGETEASVCNVRTVAQQRSTRENKNPRGGCRRAQECQWKGEARLKGRKGQLSEAAIETSRRSGFPSATPHCMNGASHRHRIRAQRPAGLGCEPQY
jgi:hypothetical protein